MTLDDQLQAFAPLNSRAVAELAGYSAGPGQLRLIRHRGARIPDVKLRALAQRLRELADAADALTACPGR